MWHGAELGNAETNEERRVILSSTLYMIMQSLRNDTKDLEVVYNSMKVVDEKGAEKVMDVIVTIQKAIERIEEIRERLKGGS